MAKQQDSQEYNDKVRPSLLRAVAGDEVADKIGTYKESYGGGTPLPKGTKAPSKAWVEANRVSQPRDADGKFTYNSVNNKPLKYGPSRGTTVPPFLIGHSIKFATKKGERITLLANDKRYISDLDLTKESFIEICRGNIKELYVMDQPLKGKRGRPSKEEIDAIDKKDIGIFKGELSEAIDSIRDSKYFINKELVFA